jgi:hypothetical protein
VARKDHCQATREARSAVLRSRGVEVDEAEEFSPQTRLITIKVTRVPGNPLTKGTFWLDDVPADAGSNCREQPLMPSGFKVGLVPKMLILRNFRSPVPQITRTDGPFKACPLSGEPTSFNCCRCYALGR